MTMKLSPAIDSIDIQAIRLWIIQMGKEKKRATGDTLTAEDIVKELTTELTDRGVTIADAKWEEPQ